MNPQIKSILFITILFLQNTILNSSDIKNKPPISRWYVTANSLKVRTEPNLKSKTVGLLEKGDSVEILEETTETITVESITSNWGKVSVKGFTGWVFKGFLSKTPPDLVSKKEAIEITKEYDQIVKKCEIEEEKLRKKDPEYQNCDPCGCGYPTTESIQNDRGCKQYKLDEIAKIAKKDGYKFNGGMSSSFSSYVEFYGDSYCLAAYNNSWSQCPNSEINFSQMKNNSKK